MTSKLNSLPTGSSETPSIMTVVVAVSREKESDHSLSIMRAV